MRMAADEDIRLMGIYQGTGPDVIMAGSPSYVSHEHSEALALEQLERRELETQVLGITIAVDPEVA